MQKLPRIENGRRDTLIRYGVALVAVAIALLLHFPTSALLGNRASYLTFFFSTMVSAAYGGYGPGLLATIAGGLLARTLIVAPGGTVLFPDPSDPTGFFRFLIINGLVTFVCGALVAAREKARSTEARLQLALDATRTVAWEWNPRSDAVVATGALQKIYGVPVRKMAEGFSLIHPADVKKHREQVELLLRQGGAYRSEFRIIRPESKETIWLEERASAIQDSVGRVARLIGVVMDISERKKVEQALHETERIYRAIGESIPFGVWICDAEGRNTYTSESFLKLVGLTQAEYSANGWAKVLHPDDYEHTVAAWQERVHSGGMWDMEHRCLGVDGQYHDIMARGVPILDAEGRTLCWAGINLDLSARKQAELVLERQAQDLRRSNRELEQFAFVASHDLQEPLRIINVYTELLLRQIGDARSPEMDQFAAFIRSGVQKMEQLIRDLLAFSRVVHAEVELNMVDSESSLRQALEVLDQMVRESGAEITFEGLPCVLAEEGPMVQIFQNLISNSIKYSKPGVTPRIHITGSSAGGQASFSVADNGIGFDERYSTTIFGLFKRLHHSEYPGTGLGLAICQRSVERYGGRIWAKSKPGEGSIFFFTVPLAAGRSSSAANS